MTSGYDFCRDAVQTIVVGTRHAIQLTRSLNKPEVCHVLLLRLGLYIAFLKLELVEVVDHFKVLNSG